MGGATADTTACVTSGFLIEPTSFRFLLKSFPKWCKTVATLKLLAARREGGIKLQPEVLSKIVSHIVSDYYQHEKASFLKNYRQIFKCRCKNERACICDQSAAMDDMENLFDYDEDEEGSQMKSLGDDFLMEYGLKATFCGPNAMSRLIFIPTIISIRPDANASEIAPEIQSELTAHYDYCTETTAASYHLSRFAWNSDQLDQFRQLIADFPQIQVLPVGNIRITLLKSGTVVQLLPKDGKKPRYMDLVERVTELEPAIILKLNLISDLEG